MSLFRSTRVDLRKEGRPLRVYFLFELFHCSQTQLSDVTIPFASYQLHYRQGNTISFLEQLYAWQFCPPQENIPTKNFIHDFHVRQYS